MLYLHYCPIEHRYIQHYIVSDTIIPYFSKYEQEYNNYLGYNNNGPSLITLNTGEVAWGKHEKEFFNTEQYCKAYNLSDEDTFFFKITYGDNLPHHTDNLHPLHNPILNMSIHTVLIDFDAFDLFSW